MKYGRVSRLIVRGLRAEVTRGLRGWVEGGDGWREGTGGVRARVAGGDG